MKLSFPLILPLTMVSPANAGALRAGARRTNVSQQSTCVDDTAWYSVYEGHKMYCNWYAQSQNCIMYQNDTNEAGTKTTKEACCATCADQYATLNVPNDENPIAVPDHLVPQGVSSDAKKSVCRDVDLSSIAVPTNPNSYSDESVGSVNLSGDDIWSTSFYMMLFVNCERQARGLKPYLMYSDDKMKGMQEDYVGRSSHDNSSERLGIAGGLAKEAAGGGPNIGLAFDANESDEDNNGNMLWDPAETGRRSTSGLVDHGDSMVDTSLYCVFATVTLNSQSAAENRYNSVLIYGNLC